MHTNFHFKLKYFLKSEINEIYILHSIRTFAISMIAIFVPIFFLKEGYPLASIALYFLVQGLLSVLLIQKFIQFAAKKGVKHSMLLSLPLTMLFFVLIKNFSLLRNTVDDLPAILILAVIAFIGNAFYFMGFHIDFAKTHTNKKSAKQVSIVQAASIIFSIFGPLAGAIIILNGSFNLLFLFIIILISLGAIPLFFSKEVHTPTKIQVKPFWKKETIKELRPYLGEGMHDHATHTFWPLLLFLLAIKLEGIGGLFTLTNIILAGLTIYLGRIITTKNSFKFLSWGVWLHAISLALRPFLKNIWPIAGVQSLGAISWGLVHVPYFATHYNNSKKTSITQVTFTREIGLSLGRSISLLMLLLLLRFNLTDTAALISMIVAGAFGTLALRYLKDEVKNKKRI